MAPGVYIHRSGGGAVAWALFLAAAFVTLWFMAVVIAAAICLALYLGLLIAGYVMTSKRLKELESKSVTAASVQLDGNYTNPRTWGVYKVASFSNGVRGNAYHLGNHPVRQIELVREHGAAELVLLFTARVDAEELKFLLNSGRLCID